MFPVKCKELLPLQHVIIHSVSVRGRLGPLTVWVSNEEQTPERRGFRMSPRFWTKIYERTHASSFRSYVELDLRNNPIVLQPGQTKAIYIHSTLPGDEAIVYDNRHSRRTHDDALLSILSGRAHVSQDPFGVRPIWGWGNPWRDQREFVGRLEYGAVYRLWNPSEHLSFGCRFQKLAKSLFLCQRRWESPMSRLPDDVIFYILNMCRWDWANDTPEEMKDLRRRRLARAEAENQVAPAAAAAAAAAAPAEESLQERSIPPSCCNLLMTLAQPPAESGDQQDDEEEGYSLAQEDEMDEEDDFEYQEFEDEEEVEEGDEDSESEADWEGDDGHGADDHMFVYQDDSEDEEEAAMEAERTRRAWIHRQFARIHVLQALAALEDDHLGT
jgi:hypothetical protein